MQMCKVGGAEGVKWVVQQMQARIHTCMRAFKVMAHRFRFISS